MACVRCAQTVAHLVEVWGKKGADTNHRVGARNSLHVPAKQIGVSVVVDRGFSLRAWCCPLAPPSAGSRQAAFDEGDILNEMPPHLRREVAVQMHRTIICRIPFFQVGGRVRACMGAWMGTRVWFVRC